MIIEIVRAHSGRSLYSSLLHRWIVKTLVRCCCTGWWRSPHFTHGFPYIGPHIILALEAPTKIVMDNILIFWFIFQRKEGLTFHVNFLLGRQFTWNVKLHFSEEIKIKNGMLSADVVIGARRVNDTCSPKGRCILLSKNTYKLIITKTRLFKYNENFTTKKWKFSEKTADIFHISAQNIDCGYSLELPQWGSSNEYP